MVRDDLYIHVPSYFRCPISLDVMKSPVSLCTGVTYDRSSIQRWLDGGNNTCPATMQVLLNKDLIPNYTLQRLIKIWSDSVLTRSNSPPTPPHSLTLDEAAQLIHQLEIDLQTLQKNCFLNSSLITHNFPRLISFAGESENGRILAAAGGHRILPLLLSLLEKVRELGLLEKIILFCNVLLKNSSKKMGSMKFDFKAAIMIALKQGRLGLRIAVAKFLDLITTNSIIDLHSTLISEDDEIYNEMLRLITTCDWNSEAVEASLNFLTRLTLPKRNRAKLVRHGGVAALAAALSAAEMSASSTEKVLKLIEMVSGCKEARIEICGSELCVKAIVKKLLKVSNGATEHAVAVLWSLCCLFCEKKAAAAVAESNGMAKILVVLQSNCSPAVRQMCADLLRVFRCSSKNSCVSWYDTKTTHIMPF